MDELDEYRKKPIINNFNEEITYRNRLISDYYIKKENNLLSLYFPSDFERARKEGPSAIEEYKDRLIQALIYGNRYFTPIEQNIFKALGLTPDDYYRIMDMRRHYLEQFNPSALDFETLASNLKKFFESIGLPTLLPEKATVYSFGCGLAPEAKALAEVLKDKLHSFYGFDKNADLIAKATRLNHQPTSRFQVVDLSQQLPKASPNLVITRHPNIYLWEKTGQKTINPDWENIIRQLKEKYPRAIVCITTVTEEEASQAASYLDYPPDQVKRNPFATPGKAEFNPYGTFHLPIAADQYYILLTPDKNRPLKNT